MSDAIGIDLGTTYSCVGVWKNDHVEIITNDQGSRTTPSYVSFYQNERLIGESALHHVIQDPINTIYEIKRLIGRKFSDPFVQEDLKHYSFHVISKDDKPYVEVDYLGEKKFFAPEEISAMVLGKMKETAEAYLGHPVKQAVITVPAYFNDAQRQATKDAGTIAGLDVIRIINEPTASSLAYGLDKSIKKELHVLVFDFGGGTHDISLLSIDDGVFTVKATGGDTHLGGSDIDNLMTSYFIEEFKKKTGNDISNDKRAVKRLRTVCERAKRTLSISTNTTIEVDGICNGLDMFYQLTRAKFEDLCLELFQRTIYPIDEVLKIAKLNKSDVDEIITVGGSSRIPKIRNLLSEYFDNKPINTSINPDEAIAYGAAIQAAILTKVRDTKIDNLIILDVVPLTLGIETAGKVMTPLIPRCTSIPVKKSQIFSTHCDNQRTCLIKIFEGERKLTSECHQLGEFELLDIPPARRGIPKIEVTYEVDANGILNISAEEKSVGKIKTITIKHNKGRLTKEEVDHMIQNANEYAQKDFEIKNMIESRFKLEQYLHNLKNSLTEEFKFKLKEDIVSLIESKISKTYQWLQLHQKESEETYKQLQKELENFLNENMKKLNS